MPEQDNYDDELVSSNPNQRNWRGIFIALLVIIIVLALIVTSVVLLTPPDEGPRLKGQRIKLQDIVDGLYTPEKVNGSWISSEEFLYLDHLRRITIINLTNLTERVLISNITYKSLAPYSFSLSADRRYILLAQNVIRLFRHSYLAQYTVFDIQTSESIKLKLNSDDAEWPYLNYAQFTPSGNELIFVHNFDIYYSQAASSMIHHRITNDAIPGIIFNGIPDWLYEEEILQSREAIWFSNNGELLLYANFNDTLVEEQHFTWYGTNEDSGLNAYLYPKIRSLRYPKPGTHNPVATLRVVNLSDLNGIEINDLQPPQFLRYEDYYFTSVNWISATEICVVWLNRVQNISVVSICSSPTFICIETHRVSGDGRGWVDTVSVPLFSANGTSYIAISPLRDGSAGYYRHIVHVHVAKKRVLPLTHGQYEVNELLHWDQLNNWVYFLGTPERLPAQQHLYRVLAVPPRHGSPLQAPECLTCPQNANSATRAEDETNLPPKLVTAWDDNWENSNEQISMPLSTAPPETRRMEHKRVPENMIRECLYYTARFAPHPLKSKYTLINCHGPVIPTSGIYAIRSGEKQTKTDADYLKTTTSYRQNKNVLELLITIQNNTRLKEKLKTIALPQVKSFPVLISGGYHAQVRLYMPPILRDEEITRYPTILHVYSGPGTQLITERWHVDWNTYLAGSKDYIVIEIDGRGSAGQGYQLLHEIYRRLGTVEISDQLEVSEYLRDNLHFIDGRRMGVWGWSYGGYAAALVLASAQSIFQCGISVSPVTNWKLYDSTYTERYLNFPNVTDNYKGYEEADLSNYVDNLRDKQFLLVHGTADDNVHVQQSMVLTRALTKKGVLFKQQIYPDEGHSLSGVKRHLYRSMAGFFDDCFKKLVPPELKAGLAMGGDLPLQ